MSKNPFPDLSGRRRQPELDITTRDRLADYYVRRWAKVHLWVERYGIIGALLVLLALALMVSLFVFFIAVQFII